MHTEYQGLSFEEIDRLECSGTAWKYEDIWYHKSLEGTDWSGQIQDYNIYGLAEFYPYDGVDLSLKALLFNRYCHWGYTDPDGFRKWYTHTYHLDEEQQKIKEEKEREERKQELLKQTRFYKGEEKCPKELEDMDGMQSTYWDYERLWVKGELEQDEQYKEMVRYFKTFIQKNQPVYKEVPLGLQAIFANRMEHWAGDGQIPSLDSVRQFCFDYERTGVEYYTWQILHQLNTHPD